MTGTYRQVFGFYNSMPGTARFIQCATGMVHWVIVRISRVGGLGLKVLGIFFELQPKKEYQKRNKEYQTRGIVVSYTRTR